MDSNGQSVYGHFADDLTGLAHFALTNSGNTIGQPITDDSGRYVMVFSGEIYNFKALQIQFPLNLRTGSAAELLLEIFVRDGVSGLSHVHGAFAFAIWDKLGRRLWVFRDRTGIKPLYYGFDEGQLVFASELRAVKNLVLEPKVNKQALYQYLLMGFVPAPLSIADGIYKLPAGHYLEYHKHTIKTGAYWKADLFAEADPHEINMDIAAVKLEKILQSTVNKYTDRKKPFKIYLTHSIESALLAHAAKKQNSRQVDTISVSTGSEASPYAQYLKSLAEAIGTNHTHLQLNPEELSEMLEQIDNVYDEPLADPSIVHTMAVTKMLAQKYGNILSAEGGNELFHGYGRYFWPERIKTFSGYWKAIYPLIGWLKLPRVEFFNQMLQYRKTDDLLLHTFSNEQGLFNFQQLEKFGLSDFDKAQLPGLSKSLLSKKRSENEFQAFWDLKYYLPDHMLMKLDRAAFYHDININFPLLDHILTEFVLNLSAGLKHHGSRNKLLLRQVVFQHIPEKHFKKSPAFERLMPYKVMDHHLQTVKPEDFVRELSAYLPAAAMQEIKGMIEENLKGNAIHKQRLYSLYRLNNYLKSF